MNSNTPQNTLSLVRKLYQRANEMDSDGFYGWGSLMRDAAKRLEELQEYKWMYENLCK